MKRLIIIHFIIIYSFSLYSQTDLTETKYLDSIIRSEYTFLTQKYDVLRLDTIESNELDYLRFWSEKQIITLRKNNLSIYSGEIINFIEKQVSKKNQYKTKTIKEKDIVSSNKTASCFMKLKELDFNKIPTGYELNDWVAIDGVSYIFESITNGIYEIKIYSSPKLFDNSIIYKNKILELVDFFESNFKSEFNSFFNNLSRGKYVIINKVYNK